MLIIVASIYAFWWLNGIFKCKFGNKAIGIIRSLHWVLAALLLISVVMASYRIYFRGFYTQVVLIWSCLFSTMLIGGFGNQHIEYRLERIYHRFMFFLPLRSGLLLLIPFLGFIILLNIYTNITVYYKGIFYEDQVIRIEKPASGPFGGSPPPTIFIKRGIFEYKQKELSMPPQVFSGLDSLNVEAYSSNYYVLKFYHRFSKDYETPFLVPVRIE
ncbi:hypothetical protein BKI52_02855 [marine bacterium AO1-C]|nr:hypothetical protein BKI52_02855 [marine bacterium AO1-C]